MSERSAGPWTQCKYTAEVIRDHNGGWIATTRGIPNARLIAAAPELLEALKEFDEFAWTAVTADCEEARVNLQRKIDKARAAIAKAEGR